MDEDKELPSIELEVWASTSLSRTAVIETKDYKRLPDDEERDVDGTIYRMANYDFSNSDLKGEFKHQYNSIKEILDTLSNTVAEIKMDGFQSRHLRILENLAEEGEEWIEDEFEVVIDKKDKSKNKKI